MISLIYFSYLMFMISLILVTCFKLIYLLNDCYTFEWLIYSFYSMKFSMIIYFDYVSILFMLVVSLISMIVFIYSFEYMDKDIFIKRFSILVLFFVMSMFLMIMSPSILTILLGWDGLGLISYCLVIYYQNNKAFNAGMLTVFSNRVGDVGILMLICLFCKFGSWNMWYMLDKFMVLLLVSVSFTKSAQIPFSLWLPAAMMAPTPVSSLVHSSTLVTAGVYLLIRFNNFLFIDDLNVYLFFISSLTMFMAGFIANYEFDFKKIIALSTLSQLGLMMMVLSLGLWQLAFFHLLVHALFKSLMFLCVGSFIHMFNNSQDIRSYGGLIYLYPFKTLVLLMSLICLMGFPFLSGYYSKDLIMEMFWLNKLNKLTLVLVMFSTLFTVSYSIRMMLYVVFSYKNYYVLLYKKESFLMNLCMAILLILIVFMGKYFYSILYWDNIIVLSFYQKLLVMKLLLLGMFLGIYYYYCSLNSNILGMYMNNMFLLNKIYCYYLYPFNFIKVYEIIYEKGLMEYKMKMLKVMYYMYIYKYSLYNLNLMLLSNMLMMMMFILIYM